MKYSKSQISSGRWPGWTGMESLVETPYDVPDASYGHIRDTAISKECWREKIVFDLADAQGNKYRRCAVEWFE